MVHLKIDLFEKASHHHQTSILRFQPVNLPLAKQCFVFFSVLKKFLFVERPLKKHTFSPGNGRLGCCLVGSFITGRFLVLKQVSNRSGFDDAIFTAFDGQECI